MTDKAAIGKGASGRRPGEQLSQWQADVAAIAGSLVHEIKNPLSTLSINTQLMLEDWANAREVRELRTVKRLTLMRAELKRLEEILRSFLSFTQRYEVNREEASINDVLDEVIEFVTEPLGCARIQVRKSLDPRVPRFAFDDGLVRQVFMNLIKNAEEAMPEGGELIIKSAYEAPDVLIDVIDTGMGIPSYQLSRLFGLYFTTKPAGSGLGLAWSRRIVREHGGDITVQSAEKKGSRFTVRLPIRERE
jgi:signal transduction histidine kinase